ncbi:hypothetical protein J5N97_019294 [Dioscorea zingiberensis]|uniref:Uncharacterized protein n=1 Tax=Dioscorea zingiberensis TaxID=325984 RepID=A0A9D5CFP4_9LILI|nr:hypothetical protein J5N97_019294 [Dioscorea zingiberensis]
MPSETIPPFQPSLALPLVAGVAILAALCASHHRKSPAKNRLIPPPIHESSKNSNQELSPPTQPCKTLSEAPAKPGLRPSSSASKRKLSMSLSVRIPEGLQRVKLRKREKQEKDEEEEEDQESLWKKTIILGDRCRIPSDEEGEAVVFDRRGNRVRNYRPRTPRSLPVSRSNSFMSSSDDV